MIDLCITVFVSVYVILIVTPSIRPLFICPSVYSLVNFLPIVCTFTLFIDAFFLFTLFIKYSLTIFYLNFLMICLLIIFFLFYFTDLGEFTMYRTPLYFNTQLQQYYFFLIFTRWILNELKWSKYQYLMQSYFTYQVLRMKKRNYWKQPRFTMQRTLFTMHRTLCELALYGLFLSWPQFKSLFLILVTFNEIFFSRRSRRFE